MINHATLVGRLTRDVDLKYTNNGTAVASFTVAVDRNFKNAQGERETDFINCVMWRKAAESFAKYTQKGSLVGVEGQIQTSTYDNKQGQKVYVTKLVVDQFSFLDPKKTDVPAQPNSKPVNQVDPASTVVNDDDLPF
ncbi:single-stranded DNA-binding protein [Schleiferilactobacillus harbinensis]|uniref:single-stranded DNA-binding protein n=1 Tax=Schleiferilactobacillus harbinensis TaxID=304207 RepID=UPI0021A63EAE|nr:single-stranded DNA-binding protein [Schleiferilactobacillus harbinensis]MCT2909283.1 single-stranded DNA-binding protein [Schleiferilactobacillus harbinensis]